MKLFNIYNEVEATILRSTSISFRNELGVALLEGETDVLKKGLLPLFEEVRCIL